ncbi:MAG: type II toxin-antitoxin system RelE/ParE family toxin [Deltaproteobacteria bacterium]|nr:type II toxin-antitoxin system RelE/ParE family toxin [Deltaproteobacteria bacterium]
MRKKILVLPLALEDLIEQSVFIAQGSQSAALRFLEMADKTFEELAEMPLMGNPAPFQSIHLAGVRRWRIRDFERHLIFYKPLEDSIEIIRVLDSSRDIESLFEE